MAEVNKITGLIVGQYGETVVLQIVDKNGTGIDVSSYTTLITVTARDSFALKVLTFTGSLNTSGTDGKIKFTPAVGNTFDRAGDWDGQVKLKSASVQTLTVPFTFVVEESLG